MDWYIRLEQGRQITPSESVLDAIAKILQLDDAEREYLFNLARPTAAGGPGDGEQPVRPGIVNMIRAFDRQAAFALGPRMAVLTDNELAWALLTDFPRRPPGERNLLEWILLDPEPRTLYKDWAVVASEMVGVPQLEASANPKDSAIAALVGKLSTSSAEFRTWWSAQTPIPAPPEPSDSPTPSLVSSASTGKRSPCPTNPGTPCSSTAPPTKNPNTHSRSSPRGERLSFRASSLAEAEQIADGSTPTATAARAPASMTRALTVLFALAGGAAVGNLYWSLV